MLVEQDFERFASMSLRSLEAQAWTQRAANQGDAMAKNAHKSEHKGFWAIMFHYHNAMPSEMTVKAD